MTPPEKIVQELQVYFERPLSQTMQDRIARIIKKVQDEAAGEKIVVTRTVIMPEPKRGENGGVLELQDVIEVVCDHLGFDKRLLSSRSRETEVVFARQLVYYFARRYTTMKLEKMAHIVAGQHWSTAINAIEQIKNYIDTQHMKCTVIADVDDKLRALLGKQLST